MSCKVIQHKFNIHYLSIGEGLGKKSYYIKVSDIPSGSKSINALFHQWWYHFYPHVCCIIFYQSAYSIFARCQSALLVFRRLYGLFGVFALVFRKSKESFKSIINWSQAGLSRSQRRNWIRRRTGKSDYKEKNWVRLRVIQEFHSDIKPRLAWFNVSSWAFTTSSEQPFFEIHLWR